MMRFIRKYKIIIKQFVKIVILVNCYEIVLVDQIKVHRYTLKP